MHHLLLKTSLSHSRSSRSPDPSHLSQKTSYQKPEEVLCMQPTKPIPIPSPRPRYHDTDLFYSPTTTPRYHSPEPYDNEHGFGTWNEETVEPHELEPFPTLSSPIEGQTLGSTAVTRKGRSCTEPIPFTGIPQTQPSKGSTSPRTHATNTTSTDPEPMPVHSPRQLRPSRTRSLSNVATERLKHISRRIRFWNRKSSTKHSSSHCDSYPNATEQLIGKCPNRRIHDGDEKEDVDASVHADWRVTDANGTCIHDQVQGVKFTSSMPRLASPISYNSTTDVLHSVNGRYNGWSSSVTTVSTFSTCDIDANQMRSGSNYLSTFTAAPSCVPPRSVSPEALQEWNSLLKNSMHMHSQPLNAQNTSSKAVSDKLQDAHLSVASGQVPAGVAKHATPADSISSKQTRSGSKVLTKQTSQKKTYGRRLAQVPSLETLLQSVGKVTRNASSQIHTSKAIIDHYHRRGGPSTPSQESFSDRISISSSSRRSADTPPATSSYQRRKFRQRIARPRITQEDQEELDRQDVLHYLMRQLLGSNHLVSMEGVTSILDLMTGSGAWALEMATEYPECQIYGVDLLPAQPTTILPPNCEFRLTPSLICKS
jgi:hypothetical protein